MADAPAAASPTYAPPLDDLTHSLRRNIEALASRRQQQAQSATRQERIASAITAFTGSMAFVYIHLAIYSVWITLNAGLIPGVPKFDPSFVILASEASVEAIFLSTFVLINQNRTNAAADRRADLDLHISLLTEHELTKLAGLITAIAAKLDITEAHSDELKEVRRDVAPEAVLDALEAREPNGNAKP